MVTGLRVCKRCTVSALADAHRVINRPKAKAERILITPSNEPPPCAYERPRPQGVAASRLVKLAGSRRRIGRAGWDLSSFVDVDVIASGAGPQTPKVGYVRNPSGPSKKVRTAMGGQICAPGPSEKTRT